MSPSGFETGWKQMDGQDRWAIAETLARYGHVVDRGELDQLESVFTSDVRYDMSAVGLPVMDGIDALREGAVRLGAQNPAAHHVTDVLVLHSTEDEAIVASKGLMITVDGGIRSVTHRDVLRRTSAGWRIASRAITPQTVPLGGRLAAGSFRDGSAA